MRRMTVLVGMLVFVGLTGALPAAAQGGPGALPITEDTFFQIIIPAIEVDVPVFQAWMHRRTWEFRVLTEEAGHLQYMPYPGMGGNVVIGGHYELAGFEPGPFYALDQLVPGDEIQVYYLGQLYTYEVIATDLVHPRDLSILQPTPYEVLTLITCYDYSPQAAIYTQRYTVRAVRVE